MPWDTYLIPIKGKTENLDHHHALVVEVSGNWLCVPSFTSGKPEVEEAIKAFGKMGIFPHQCSVELDNAKHVKFKNGRVGHLSTWLVGRRQILSDSLIKRLKPSGEIDDRGMLAIMDCFIEFSRASPSTAIPKFTKVVEIARADLLSALNAAT